MPPRSPTPDPTPAQVASVRAVAGLLVALNPDVLTPRFLRTPQTGQPSGGTGLPSTTAHTQALPFPAPTPAGLGPEDLHGPPWVLRPPLGARGGEREEGPLAGAPSPFQRCGVHGLFSSPGRRGTALPQEAFPRPGGEGALKAGSTQASPLPPTWACRYLCVAGFHFNGSNLRMRQCHFYEVGVKKIYSLFQKAFFFFFQGKKV